MLYGDEVPLVLLELAVLELAVPEFEVPLLEPLGEELEPELPDDVPLDPADVPLEPLDGWLPEPLDSLVPFLGVSSCVIGFGDGPVEVGFGVSDAAGGLAALPSVGSTTFG